MSRYKCQLSHHTEHAGHERGVRKMFDIATISFSDDYIQHLSQLVYSQIDKV